MPPWTWLPTSPADPPMPHRPRKRFGQHFLVAADVIDQVVSAVAPQPTDTIVEIGPGQAAITDALAAGAGHLHAIEFDRDLAAALTRQVHR